MYEIVICKIDKKQLYMHDDSFDLDLFGIAWKERRLKESLLILVLSNIITFSDSVSRKPRFYVFGAPSTSFCR